MPVMRAASMSTGPVPSIVPCGVPSHQIPTEAASPPQKARVSHRRAHVPRAWGRATRAVGPNVVLCERRTGGGAPTARISDVDVAGAGSAHGGAGRRPVTGQSYQTTIAPDDL